MICMMYRWSVPGMMYRWSVWCTDDLYDIFPHHDLDTPRQTGSESSLRGRCTVDGEVVIDHLSVRCVAYFHVHKRSALFVLDPLPTVKCYARTHIDPLPTVKCYARTHIDPLPTTKCYARTHIDPLPTVKCCARTHLVRDRPASNRWPELVRQAHFLVNANKVWTEISCSAATLNLI